MRDDVEVDGVGDDAVREVSIGVRGSARGRCVVVTVVAGERVVTSGEGDGKEEEVLASPFDKHVSERCGSRLQRDRKRHTNSVTLPDIQCCGERLRHAC